MEEDRQVGLEMQMSSAGSCLNVWGSPEMRDLELRREAMHLALNAASGQTRATAELIKDAKTILKFIKGS